MSTSANTINEGQIAKSSRRSALISILGLLIVFLALGYSAWQLQRLRTHVQHTQEELVAISQQRDNVKSELTARLADLHAVKSQLKGAREAVFYVKQGINYYHAGRYHQAIKAYDQALELDPENAYIANLKGYSLFKVKQYEDAIDAMKLSVEIDPTYAWGYFDLARVLCAKTDFSSAKQAIREALERQQDLRETMLSDGEFTRLCRPILDFVRDGENMELPAQ
jgi:tetratricopeptide (TPR) repeat protein